MFLSYGFMFLYIRFMRLSLKETASETYVFKTLKIESMHVHLFIIKPEEAGTMTTTH